MIDVRLVPFRIEVFDLKDEVLGAAKGFASEGGGLADRGRACWLNMVYLDIGPIGIVFPLGEVLPHHLDRGGGGDRIHCEAHRVLLLFM
jgi:hypothetical protein